jgi:hypothetical protein
MHKATVTTPVKEMETVADFCEFDTEFSERCQFFFGGLSYWATLCLDRVAPVEPSVAPGELGRQA